MKRRDPPEDNAREVQDGQYTLRAWEDYSYVTGIENVYCESVLNRTPVHFEVGTEVHAKSVS